jgi:hypothetical protein
MQRFTRSHLFGIHLVICISIHCSSYLWRLMNLHGSRTASLKRILLVAPEGHPKNSPTLASCAGTEQRVLRAWAFATAYLAWESRPDLPSIVIAQALTPLLDHMYVLFCIGALFPVSCPLLSVHRHILVAHISRERTEIGVNLGLYRSRPQQKSDPIAHVSRA